MTPVSSSAMGAAAGVQPAAPRAEAGDRRRISVLGATGSIGDSTLDLVNRNPDVLEVVALTAQSNVAKLASLARRHGARLAVIGDERLYPALKTALAGSGIRAAAGPSGLVEAAAQPADCVMAAISGAARHGTDLFPVDSEHSAAFQALHGAPQGSIERIVLTASGGPFRTWSKAQLASATPEQALKHPNWSMGAKITIDSATLMNKGLELIEAYHLFPVEKEQLGAVVHPQSIVHCLVTYCDGSVLAQLSCPDMRIPISLSLAWPRRMSAPVERLDLVKAGRLDFEEVDAERFPSIGLARVALLRGNSAPAILNAANEVAVAAFLERRIGFLDIPRIVDQVLQRAERDGLVSPLGTLTDVLAVDGAARRMAHDMLSGA